MTTAHICLCKKAISVDIVDTACTTYAVAPTVHWCIDGTQALSVARSADTIVINRLKRFSENGLKYYQSLGCTTKATPTVYEEPNLETYLHIAYQSNKTAANILGQ